MEETSRMYQLTICLMSTRRYVQSIVGFLYPEGKYFGNCAIACEDFREGQEKTLDLIVLGMIKEDVWLGFYENLIPIKRYVYFNSDLKNECYFRTESKVKGVLPQVLEDLRTIHSRSFENTDSDSDNVKDVSNCPVMMW